ncbi:MAG: glutamate--tRNA ligase [Candidatus Hodarchaeales archaeon]|jgi:glutamyl-tRNA synthetase
MESDETILKITLLNAIKYKGKANAKSTLGAVIQSNPQYYKSRIQETRAKIEETVEFVNNLTLKQQEAQLMKIDPQSLQPKEKKKKEISLELSNLNRFDEVALRLAPYPSGPLHIGNCRMVVLNDYLARKYNGKLYLFFDDTIGSKTKLIDPEAYDSIPEGLEFLNVKIHKTYYKSDRLDIFYKYCVQILRKEKAYVCDCDGTKWRQTYKEEKKACPCRSLSLEENLSRWEKMLDGTYPEQGAAVRLKTEMDAPDPAIRDPVMLRISEREHPRVGTKYRVWPLLEFSWGIDDHELKISHIIRGKDLRKEGILEERIWDIFNWKKPTINLYGRMKLKDLQLSKSSSAEKIRLGEYENWSDPRTWTLQSLERRGIKAEAIKQALLEVGMSPVDVTFSPSQIYSVNRSMIDAEAGRFFLTIDPIVTTIKGVPEVLETSHPLIHPEFPERGTRSIEVPVTNRQIEVYIPQDDIADIKKGTLIRLKDLVNITLESVTRKKAIAKYHSVDLEEARQAKASMIQWVPVKSAIQAKILRPDGSYLTGLAEPEILGTKPGQIIQFERYAFCRVESINDSVELIWTHR